MNWSLSSMYRGFLSVYFQIKGFTIRILNIPLTLQLTPSGGTKPISKRFSFFSFFFLNFFGHIMGHLES